MVLDIRLPEGLKHANTDQLRRAFFELPPKALAYGISFFLVAKFWLGHLKIFSQLKDYDPMLLGYNLCYLFTVSFFPFAATLFSGNVNPDGEAYSWAIYTYTGIVFACAISQALLCRYLMKHRQKLCFEPQKLDATLKYKATQYNFIVIPLTILLMIAIRYMDYPPIYSMFPLAFYGFTTSVISRKNYPEENTRPIIFRLFETIRTARLKRKSHKKLILKDKA
jgi:uncharacterized membrane protein